MIRCPVGEINRDGIQTLRQVIADKKIVPTVRAFFPLVSIKNPASRVSYCFWMDHLPGIQEIGSVIRLRCEHLTIRLTFRCEIEVTAQIPIELKTHPKRFPKRTQNAGDELLLSLIHI